MNFCSNGNFDAYDFRSLGEIRKNDQIQTGITGNNQWLEMKHSWTLGIDELIRTVHKGTSIYGDPYLMPNGQDNLYQNISSGAPTPTTSYGAGPVYKILDHSQFSLFLNDQIDINQQAKLYAGLRLMQMHQKAYDVTSGTPYAELNKWWLLPQIGISYSLSPQITNYISYSKGVEPGTIALVDSFTNQSVMPPKQTQQYEIGTKYAINPESLLTFALFEMKRPNEFSLYDTSTNDGRYRLYQEGDITNRGAEISLAQKVTNRLNLLASAMYLRANQSGAVTDPTQNGKQAIGIPHWRSIVNADYLIPNYEHLSIQGSWTYSSGKPIDLQNTIQAPSYNKFDAGLKYFDRVGKSQATYRLFVENVFNKFYWRDVSQSFGANMLYPGAPRILRATATFDF
jgi:iron complex outermembrane receptor protein